MLSGLTRRPIPVHVSRQNWLAAAYSGLFGLALLQAITGCSRTVQASRKPQSTSTSSQTASFHTYQAEVLPVLQANCYRCHTGMNRRGGLDMSTRARLLQGGKDGAVVIPGRPEDSLLVRAINPSLSVDDPMRMPPKGTRLTDAQVAAIRKWVADGAVMDR